MIRTKVMIMVGNYQSFELVRPVHPFQLEALLRRIEKDRQKVITAACDRFDVGEIAIESRAISCGDLGLPAWELVIAKNRSRGMDKDIIPWFDIFGDHRPRILDECYIMVHGIEFLSVPYRNGKPLFRSFMIRAAGIDIGHFILDHITREGEYYLKKPLTVSPQNGLSMEFYMYPFSGTIRFPLVLRGLIMGERRNILSNPQVIPVEEEGNGAGVETLKAYRGFFCQVCQKTHPPSTRKYQCIQCYREACQTCVEEMKMAGMEACPHCEGKLEEA